MPLLINKNISELQQIVESLGYTKRGNRGDEIEYLKNIPTGRMHLFLQTFNDKNTSMNLHFDKYKGKRQKIHHHTTAYKHPYVKKEEDIILEKIKASSD